MEKFGLFKKKKIPTQKTQLFGQFFGLFVIFDDLSHFK